MASLKQLLARGLALSVLVSSAFADTTTRTGELYLPSPGSDVYAVPVNASFSTLDATMVAIRCNVPSASAVGDAVYIDGSGNAQLSKADSVSTARVDGFIQHKISSTDARVILSGRVTPPSLVAGTDYYLSATTAGKLTSTAPTSPNLQILVGRAYNDAGTPRLMIHNDIPDPASTTEDLQGAYDNGTAVANIDLDPGGALSIRTSASSPIFTVTESTASMTGTALSLSGNAVVGGTLSATNLINVEEIETSATGFDVVAPSSLSPVRPYVEVFSAGTQLRIGPALDGGELRLVNDEDDAGVLLTEDTLVLRSPTTIASPDGTLNINNGDGTHTFIAAVDSTGALTLDAMPGANINVRHAPGIQGIVVNGATGDVTAAPAAATDMVSLRFFGGTNIEGVMVDSSTGNVELTPNEVTDSIEANGTTNINGDLTADGLTGFGTAETIALTPGQTTITVTKTRVAIDPDAAGNTVDEILCPTCDPGDIIILSKLNTDPFTLDGVGSFATDSIGEWQGGDCEMDGGQSISVLYRTGIFNFWKVASCNSDVTPRVLLNSRTMSATGALLSTDDVVKVDTSGGAVTVNLLPAASVTGRVFHFKKITGPPNAMVLDGSGAETIDGAATQSATSQWTNITIYSDGTAWFIL